MSSDTDSADLSLGILGVLTIIPIVAGFIYTLLPNAQLHYFDQIVAETESFLLSLEEQGVFRDPTTGSHYRSSLHSVRRQAEAARIKTYCATSLWQQLKGLVNGLSKKLSDLSAMATMLRAEISTTASEELALANTAHAPSVSLVQSDDALEGDVDGDILNPQIVRPEIMCSPDVPSKTLSDSAVPVTVSTAGIPPPLASRSLHHLGDHANVFRNPKKRRQSEQYLRRSKRYFAARGLSSTSIPQMEHKKCGVMRSDDFKRALRARTYDSVLSGSTCVSEPEPDTLPLHVKPAGDRVDFRRVLTLFGLTTSRAARYTRSPYRVAYWLPGININPWVTSGARTHLS
ncbi:hypothetical protein C8Q74DRAFT_588018 [Fomes fomentarius]|nr:hypothetical protein C8Q74DRAFT_588018 [Fomes fomentarius]